MSFKALIVLIIANFTLGSGIAQNSALPFSIPLGYVLRDSASADLNADGRLDYVVILDNANDSINTELSRPLLIYFGTLNSDFKLVARNDSVVLCKSGGGMMGDPLLGITIKGRYFTIEHYGGAGWRWTRFITFKYDGSSRKFLLHRDAGLSWHSSIPESMKDEVFHSERFDVMDLSEYTNVLD